MKIDFNQPMRNPYGAPIPLNDKASATATDDDDGDEKLLLGHVCVNALTVSFQGDKRDGAQKVACWKLSQKLFAADGEEYHFQEVDIKAKEVTMLMDLIEKVYPSPVIYAQALEMLEPEAEDVKTDKKEG